MLQVWVLLLSKGAAYVLLDNTKLIPTKAKIDLTIFTLCSTPLICICWNCTILLYISNYGKEECNEIKNTVVYFCFGCIVYFCLILWVWSVMENSKPFIPNYSNRINLFIWKIKNQWEKKWIFFAGISVAIVGLCDWVFYLNLRTFSSLFAMIS